jgi:hypothetical protein
MGWSCSGFSAVETLTALSAASMLAAAGAPALDGYIAQAKLAHAINDGKVIALGMSRLTYDICQRDQRAAGFGTQRLLASAGRTPQLGTGGAADWTDADAGSLTAHLVTNDTRYPTRRAEAGSFASSWRGPYVDGAVGADPWGHRYAVNVRWLAADTPLDTIVLSAGPNGLIETAFAKDGLLAGGDDLVTIVSTGR